MGVGGRMSVPPRPKKEFLAQNYHSLSIKSKKPSHLSVSNALFCARSVILFMILSWSLFFIKWLPITSLASSPYLLCGLNNLLGSLR
ncbi:hypothetical protein QQP08_022160 [Theobroma cacao]|nr:hypothetical protein QQP08_022160 [Theobroma cacao]